MLWFREDAGLNYLFFKVANVAQIESGHFDECEEDHPGDEQSLVVLGQIIELEMKKSCKISTGMFPQCLWMHKNGFKHQALVHDKNNIQIPPVDAISFKLQSTITAARESPAEMVQ